MVACLILWSLNCFEFFFGIWYDGMREINNFIDLHVAV